MIIEFKFKNYKSYKEEAILSFEALENDYRRENYLTVTLESGEEVRLVKSAAILGANASGKSNVIWALHSLIYIILNSRKFDNRTAIPVFLPFLFQKNGRYKPTENQLDFIVNRKRYRYVVRYDLFVRFEGLYLIENGQPLVVYEINNENGPRGFVIGDAWQSEVLDLSNEVYANQLFMSVCGTMPKHGLLDVYGALADIQTVPIHETINLKAVTDAVSDNILKNKVSILSQLKRLISIADIGVSDIKVRENKQEDFGFPDSVPEAVRKDFVKSQQWDIKLEHISNGDKYDLDMRFESTGTKYLFGMGARVLDVLSRGGLLACDEMNIATHPELFKLLVSLFNDPKSNPKNAQLLFTTHDASVVSDGAFRADQVWFAEKNENGESELFSAQDFEGVGISIPFDAWYKSGRFGALPKFGHIDYIFEDEQKDKADER